MKKRFLMFFAFIFCINAIAQKAKDCDSIIILKNQTYGFTIKQLNDSTKEMLSKKLDKFWDFVEKKKGADCLSKLIEQESKDGFFLMDASTLLLRLDYKNKKYFKQICLGLKKTPNEEIQIKNFLQIVLFLNREGVIDKELVKKYFSIMYSEISLSEHFMGIDKFTGNLIILGSLPTDISTELIIEELEKKPFDKDLLLLLSIQFNDKSINYFKNKVMPDSIIQAIDYFKREIMEQESFDSLKIKFSRKELLKILKEYPDFKENSNSEFVASNIELTSSAIKYLTKEDIPLLLDARKRSLFGLSDESLDEYYGITSLILKIKNK